MRRFARWMADGELHLPLATVNIDVYRRSPADPARGTILIRRPWLTDGEAPAERVALTGDPGIRRLRLDVGPRTPTQFTGMAYRGGRTFVTRAVHTEGLNTDRIEFRFGGEFDDYFLWNRQTPVPDAVGIEFDMRVSDVRGRPLFGRRGLRPSCSLCFDGLSPQRWISRCGQLTGSSSE